MTPTLSVQPIEPARTRSTLLTLIALWILFYSSFTLFVPPLLDDADSVHAEVAREMLVRHDLVTLYANGIRYLEKAPLLYWSMALSMKLFGVSAAAARLPLALTVLGLALTLAGFARRAFARPPAALYAGLIILSSFGIFIFTRINIPDADVCLWLTLALFCFWRTEQQDHPSLILTSLFAVCCALNVLTKGLIGLVFPIATVSIHLLLTRGLRAAISRVRQLHPIACLTAFLVVAAPWHVLIGFANPTQGHPGNLSFQQGHWSIPLPTDGNVHGWTWFYFVNEQFLRYLNLRVPRDYDTVPLALFWGLLFIWLMPWSAFLFHAIAAAVPLRSNAWRTRLGTHTLIPRERTLLLLALWAAIPMLFFSLSTRQEYYVLPSIPALTLIIAAWLADGSISSDSAERKRSPIKAPVYSTIAYRPECELADASNAGMSARRISVALLLIGTLASVACIVLVLNSKAPGPDIDLATLLQQNPGNYALSFGHFLDLNAQAMGAFRIPLLLTATALFTSSFANFLLRRYQRPHAANLALAAGTLVFLFAAHLGLRTFAPVLSSHELAISIAPQVHPQDLIVLHGEYEAGSTLGFYLKRNDLHIVEGRSSNLWYGSFFPDAPTLFETRESVAERWLGAQRIFLWEDRTDRDRPPLLLPTPSFLIAKSGGKEILSNQPNH